MSKGFDTSVIGDVLAYMAVANEMIAKGLGDAKETLCVEVEIKKYLLQKNAIFKDIGEYVYEHNSIPENLVGEIHSIDEQIKKLKDKANNDETHQQNA